MTQTPRNLGRAGRPHPARAHPPLPGWMPPVCAVLFGAGVALQAPSDAEPGLTAPLVGLALALGAWALLVGVRTRQGVPRRSRAGWALAATVVIVPAFHYHAADSASDLRWVYLALGVAVAGIGWYRLRKGPRR